MIGEIFFRFRAKLCCQKNEYRCVVQMHGSEHTRCFQWIWSDAVVFRLFKVFSSSLQHIRCTYNWSKIQLSWVLMLYYPYKTMFSTYRSVIVSPCACDLFVSSDKNHSVHGCPFLVVIFQRLVCEGGREVYSNQPQPDCWNYLYCISIHSCKYTTQHFK